MSACVCVLVHSSTFQTRENEICIFTLICFCLVLCDYVTMATMCEQIEAN